MQDGAHVELGGRASFRKARPQEERLRPAHCWKSRTEQTLLDSGHTHPYDYHDGHLTNVPFSGDDLAEHVTAKQRLDVVQSGEGIFASARPKEFDALVQGRDEDGQEALASEIRLFWNNLFYKHEGDSQARAEAATRATSEQYHLLYYAGKQGILEKVDTSSESKQKGHKEHAAHSVK